MQKTQVSLEFPLFPQSMPAPSDFAGRIVEFGKGFDRVAIIINETKDSGDVFKALHQYVVLKGFRNQIEPLLKNSEELLQAGNFTQPETAYEEIAFKQSGLEEILKSIALGNDAEMPKGYDKVVKTIKNLLSIYEAAMAADLNHPADDHKQQLETAAALSASSTPVPGAPKGWCEFFMGAALFLFIGLLIALGGSSNNN